jgi:hypothetical protein
MCPSSNKKGIIVSFLSKTLKESIVSNIFLNISDVMLAFGDAPSKHGISLAL